MSIIVREIATIVARTDKGLTIELNKHLIPQSLDGISSWSHCWLLYLDDLEASVQMHLFSIGTAAGKQLRLESVGALPRNIETIFDIKPLHRCDLGT